MSHSLSDFYSDSDFDDAEGPEVLAGPRERPQGMGGHAQQNGTSRQSSLLGIKFDGGANGAGGGWLIEQIFHQHLW